MKYIRSYNELNEELSRNQRMWIHLPIILGGLLLNKLTGVQPLFNYKWNEIKKKTTNSKFDPILASSGGELKKIKREFKKITRKDIPENKLGFSMFLRNWNIYLVTNDTHSDNSSNDPKYQRPIVYITKDEVKTGDYCIGERISDNVVYPDFKYSKKTGNIKPDNLNEYPIIVMIAKGDKAEETISMTQYIDDICLELEDDLMVKVDPYFNKNGDQISINIKPIDSKIYFTDELDSKLDTIRKSVESYLQGEGYILKGTITYYVENLWYFGDKGRFKEMKEMGELYDKQYLSYEDDPRFAMVSVSESKKLSLNIEKCCNSSLFLNKRYSKKFGYDKYDFRINSNDLRLLISDKENCSTTHYVINKKLSNSDPNSIELKSIKIYFSV
jgi:hypothetical protein